MIDKAKLKAVCESLSSNSSHGDCEDPNCEGCALLKMLDGLNKEFVIPACFNTWRFLEQHSDDGGVRLTDYGILCFQIGFFLANEYYKVEEMNKTFGGENVRP